MKLYLNKGTPIYLGFKLYFSIIFLIITPLILGCVNLFLLFFDSIPIYFILAALIFRLMKKIEAIIRKSKFSEVKEALHQVGVNFFSYWDVTGLGNEKEGHVYRGVSYSTSDIQRRYLSIVVNDDFEQPAIEAILQSAATGHVGDGKIFVSDIQDVYRIRTGEKGGQTLN